MTLVPHQFVQVVASTPVWRNHETNSQDKMMVITHEFFNMRVPPLMWTSAIFVFIAAMDNLSGIGQLYKVINLSDTCTEDLASP